MNFQKKSGFSTSKTNPVEIVGEQAMDIVKSAANEAKGTLDIAFEQIGLKQNRKPAPWSSEISVSQQIQVLENKNKAAEIKIEKLQQQLFRGVNRETREVFNSKKESENRRVQELVIALSKEVGSLKYQTAQLTGDIKNITVETITLGQQTYHINFFEWVLAMVKDIKKDIVKSRTWLSTFNSKKAKKGYWAMFKKHGTSFAMSDERGIATAAG